MQIIKPTVNYFLNLANSNKNKGDFREKCCFNNAVLSILNPNIQNSTFLIIPEYDSQLESSYF